METPKYEKGKKEGTWFFRIDYLKELINRVKSSVDGSEVKSIVKETGISKTTVESFSTMDANLIDKNGCPPPCTVDKRGGCVC